MTKTPRRWARKHADSFGTALIKLHEELAANRFEIIVRQGGHATTERHPGPIEEARKRADDIFAETHACADVRCAAWQEEDVNRRPATPVGPNPPEDYAGEHAPGDSLAQERLKNAFGRGQMAYLDGSLVQSIPAAMPEDERHAWRAGRLTEQSLWDQSYFSAPKDAN